MAEELGSMIEYTESLADVESPKALPLADYPGEVITALHVLSNSSGKPQLAVTFRIKPEDFPADFEDADAYPDGVTATFYRSTEQTKSQMFRMRRFLEALGVKLGKKLDANDLVGKTAILSVEPDEFEGIENTRIRKVSAA